MNWYALLIFAPFILGVILSTVFRIAVDRAHTHQRRMLYLNLSDAAIDLSVGGTAIFIFIAAIWR